MTHKSIDLYLFVVTSLMFVPWGSATQYYISPNGSASGDGSAANPFGSLQMGLNHANKSGGDILILTPGTYSGPQNYVNVTFSVNITAEKAGQSIIDCASNSSANGITLSPQFRGASKINLSKLVFQNCMAGIYIAEASLLYASVEDSMFVKGTDGILALSHDHLQLVIKSCNFSAQQSTALTSGGGTFMVQDSLFEGSPYGMLLQNSGLDMQRCVFQKLTDTALWLYRGYAVVAESQFRSIKGMAVYLYESSYTDRNSTYANNQGSHPNPVPATIDVSFSSFACFSCVFVNNYNPSLFDCPYSSNVIDCYSCTLTNNTPSSSSCIINIYP